jgi:hypothetical protein
MDYEYQTSWSVHGREAIRVPADHEQWIKSNTPIITLNPPFERVEVEVDADRLEFDAMGVNSAVVEFRYPLFRKQKQERKAVLRATDSEQSKLLTFYRDEGQKTEFRITWYAKNGGRKLTAGWKALDETYLSLSPPKMGPADIADD